MPRPKCTLNANPFRILGSKKRPILFIHVGKCAGTSIKTSLSELIFGNYIIHEMHCFDANQRIADVVENDAGQVEYLICTRNPITRFVSAFNWDKHSMYLSGMLTGTDEADAFSRFKTIHDLLHGLQSMDHAEMLSAATIATSEVLHMGMSQSWYTPTEIVERLPPSRTTIIDTQSIRSGILQFIRKLGCSPPAATWDAPKDNSDYKLWYPDPEKEFPTTLTAEEESFLGKCLMPDILVYQHLLDLRRSQVM
jgi:hypothetical protein